MIGVRRDKEKKKKQALMHFLGPNDNVSEKFIGLC